MATTINTRQIELDSSTSRIVQIATTLSITSTASEFVKEETDSQIIQPSAGITLTAASTITTIGNYTWSYKNNTQSLYTVISGQTTNTLAVSTSNFATYVGSGTSVTFKVEVQQVGIIGPSVNFYTVQYSQETADVITIVLSRPNVLVFTNDAGTPTTLAGTGTTVQVVKNGVYLPYHATNSNSFSMGTTTVSNITMGSGSGTGNVYTFADIGSFTADTGSATITVNIKNAYGTTRTARTVVQNFLKVKSGGSSLSATLTNDTHAIPTDAAGSNAVYTNSGTDIYVYDGSTQLSYDGTGTANGTWTVSAAGTSITPGSITDQGTYARVAVASAITSDTAKIDYTITGKTGSGVSFSFVKTQTFTRARSGSNPIIYDIITSSPVITKEAFDSATSGVHSSITIQGKKYDGNTTTNYGWITVTGNGVAEAATATDTAGSAVTLSPAAGDGRTSYTIKMYNQAGVSGATLLDTEVVNVVFKGNTGTTGSKYITVSAFQWLDSGVPTAPTQAAVFTWSTNAVDVYPSGWTSSAGAAPGTGYTLYQLNIKLSAAGPDTTTAFNWNTGTVGSIGYRQDGTIGVTGDSARRAYQVNTSSSAPASPGTVAGDVTPSGWSASATSTLTAGQYLWQVDGTYSTPNNQIVWGNPYLSNLKVGTLSAIATDTGNLTISTTGSIKNVGGGYGSSGFFLGYDSTAYKFSVGDGTAGNTITWNGTTLAVPAAKITGTLTASQINSNGLSIKDNAGNVILGVSTNLSNTRIDAANGWLNSNITVNTGVLTGIGTSNIQVDNTYQAIGQNLLPNSEQKQTVCFGGSWNPYGANISNFNQYASNTWGVDSYTLSGTTTRNIWSRQLSYIAGGNDAIAFDTYPTGGWGRDYGIPVVAGQKYIWSCYIASHRCKSSIGMTFWNAAGGSLGDYGSSIYDATDSSANKLSDYHRPYVGATAPSGAVSVSMYLRKYNTKDSQGDSYIWYAAPQLEAVASNATTPSPYIPGPTTSTGQLGYTGALDANNTYVDGSGRIQGVSSGGNQIVLNGNIVIDSTSTITGIGGLINRVKPNLLDPGKWVVGSSGSQTAPNPAFYANASSGTLNDIIWTSYNPTGELSPVWRAQASAEGGPQGGWDTGSFSIDHTKSYRFSVWVLRSNSSPTGNFYFGCGGDTVKNIGDGTVNSNPYFIVIPCSSLPTGFWCLAVGYIFHSSTAELSYNYSALYDIRTGKKITSGGSFATFKWKSDSTSSVHRTYQYYTTTANQLMQWWSPAVEVLDGSERTLTDLLTPTYINDRNKISWNNVDSYVGSGVLRSTHIGNPTLVRTYTNYLSGSTSIPNLSYVSLLTTTETAKNPLSPIRVFVTVSCRYTIVTAGSTLSIRLAIAGNSGTTAASRDTPPAPNSNYTGLFSRTWKIDVSLNTSLGSSTLTEALTFTLAAQGNNTTGTIQDIDIIYDIYDGTTHDDVVWQTY